MRSALARFLLSVSASSFRTAMGLLLRSKRLKRVEPGDQQALAAAMSQVGEIAGKVIGIVRRAQGRGPTNLPLAGFTYLPSFADERKIIVFDLTDGSQCYYIDPPGVCCCKPC